MHHHTDQAQTCLRVEVCSVDKWVMAILVSVRSEVGSKDKLVMEILVSDRSEVGSMDKQVVVLRKRSDVRTIHQVINYPTPATHCTQPIIVIGY